MCKLALLAALFAATVPGDPPDSRYQCWSACQPEFDEELVVTSTAVAGPDLVLPDFEPAESGRFSGIGWTFGNLFDDLEDTGSTLGPGDYSNLELNSIADVDGLSLVVSLQS